MIDDLELLLKVKQLHISTGSVRVAILHIKDAEQLGANHEDRIGIIKGKGHIQVIVDITEDERIVKPGEIGLMKESFSAGNFKSNDQVRVYLRDKPKSLEIIKKMLSGSKTSKEDIHQIMEDISNGYLSDTEIAFFVASGYIRGFDKNRTRWLTQAMVESGDRLVIDAYPVMDKHCVGGVPGNRTTMIVVPILMAAGLHIPKTSSRSITSPAGTADTMEVLCNVSLRADEMKKIVEKIGGCIAWGGSMNLAPADDRIIKIEKVLSIDGTAQLLASVLAKKYSVGATHLLVDIPLGRSCKSKTMKEAKSLRRAFIEIGTALGMNVRAIITDGRQPVGNGIGPLLEAEDVLKVLRNSLDQPRDLRQKATMMAGILLEMGGKARYKKGMAMAEELLTNGSALSSMEHIIEAQGRLPTPILGKHTFDCHAHKSGTIKEIDNVIISKIARIAGCPADKGAGIYLYRKCKDKVQKGEVLFRVYAQGKARLLYAQEFCNKSSGYHIS